MILAVFLEGGEYVEIVPIHDQNNPLKAVLPINKLSMVKKGWLQPSGKTSISIGTSEIFNSRINRALVSLIWKRVK